MDFENSLIFKPNELIEVISRPISILGLKAYNIILQKLQKANTDRMIISPSEILSEIGATDSYEELYAYLDELQKTQVKSIDKRGKLWGSFVLISEFKKLDEGIFVAVPPTIYNVLCGKEKEKEKFYYTTIKLLEEKSFKCSYSIIFYEIFKKYEQVTLPIYSLEELKDLTKTNGKYKIYYEFKRWVLNPALKEINKFNDKYKYSFQEEYFGRRVDKIKFIKEPKNTQVIEIQPKLDKSSFSDELLKAIEKARKNRFINDKYSQRAVEKAIIQHGEELVAKALFKLYKFEFTVKSFTKLLNSTVQEIKSLNEVNAELKKRETEEDKKIENSSTPITPVNELSELDSLKSLVLAQAKSQISIEEWSKLSLNLIKIKTKEELDDFIKNYELLINYKLF